MSDPSSQLPPGQLTFTIDQAAALLGISKSTAYESAHRGELPVLRFGRRLVVTRAALEALLGLDAPAAANTPVNERRQPRRTRWMRVTNGETPPGPPPWAAPHRRSSTA
jgi:excisionase family DNA binding protein